MLIKCISKAHNYDFLKDNEADMMYFNRNMKPKIIVNLMNQKNTVTMYVNWLFN
jgi:hypothetical protein